MPSDVPNDASKGGPLTRVNDLLRHKDRRALFSPNEKFLDYVIAGQCTRRAGETGPWSCKLSVRVLQQLTGWSRSTVLRTIRELEDSPLPAFSVGLTGPEDGHRRCTRFVECLDPAAFAAARDAARMRARQAYEAIVADTAAPEFAKLAGRLLRGEINQAEHDRRALAIRRDAARRAGLRRPPVSGMDQQKAASGRTRRSGTRALKSRPPVLGIGVRNGPTESAAAASDLPLTGVRNGPLTGVRNGPITGLTGVRNGPTDRSQKEVRTERSSGWTGIASIAATVGAR